MSGDDLSSLLADVASSSAHARGQAMQRLRQLAQIDSRLRSTVRPIFESAIAHETDAWAALSAVRSLEELDGVEVTRGAWRSLLSRPDAVFASRVVAGINHVSHVPMLIELLMLRDETPVRCALIRSLGRLKDRSAIQPMLRFSDVFELQPCLVGAFSDLGDPSLIPWIERFISDERRLPELDDRGYEPTLGLIAQDAVARLSRQTNVAVPPPIPMHNAPAVRLRRNRIIAPALLPLLAAVAELGWLVFLFLLYLFICGDQRPPQLPTRLVDALAMLPAAVGVGAGVVVLLTGQCPKTWEKVVALVGISICSLFTFSFGYEMIAG